MTIAKRLQNNHKFILDVGGCSIISTVCSNSACKYFSKTINTLKKELLREFKLKIELVLLVHSFMMSRLRGVLSELSSPLLMLKKPAVCGKL